jgi:hypothetical protein
MNSRDVFETHFRSADVLLRVYRLLESEHGPLQEHALLPQLRSLITCAPDEDVILLLNELFVGVVRERAELKAKFFRKDNLDLLLRQSVVTACSALDVFVPNLLQSFLPDVVRIRQRNFLPNDGEVKVLLGDFRLKLDEVWPLAEALTDVERWDFLTMRVLKHLEDKTLSNDAGVSAALALLAVEKPWGKIAARAGDREQDLRDKLKRIVARRNDIVHRADRARTDPTGDAQPIDYVWAQNHVGAVQTIALACYDLARERVEELRAATVAA